MGRDAAVGDGVGLPQDVTADLDELGLQELREAVRYAQRRIRERQRPVSDRIEAAPGEEIVSVRERSEYTEVVKREPCGEGCPDCPHGPYLYHVYEETHPDGQASLHWVFLGPVYDVPGGESA